MPRNRVPRHTPKGWFGLLLGSNQANFFSNFTIFGHKACHSTQVLLFLFKTPGGFPPTLTPTHPLDPPRPAMNPRGVRSFDSWRLPVEVVQTLCPLSPLFVPLHLCISSAFGGGAPYPFLPGNCYVREPVKLSTIQDLRCWLTCQVIFLFGWGCFPQTSLKPAATLQGSAAT